MIKLKQLLIECFIIDTFLDLFKENPNIYYILKNNILDINGNIIKYKNQRDLADELTHWGGSLGCDGINNWNKKDVINFFEKMYKINSISYTTLQLLKIKMEYDYKVFQKDYIINMIQKVGNRLEKEKIYKGWTDNAMKDFNMLS